MAFSIPSLFKKKQKQNKPVTDEIGIVSLQDRFSSYPSKGLTPSKLAGLLRAADEGDVTKQMELFEEMLEKDGHLLSLFQARKMAVSRRNYSIIPASDKPKDVEIAQAVDKEIKRIRGWRNVVNEILDAVPMAYSVNEIYWEPVGDRFSIDRVKHLHPKRFRFGKLSDPLSDPDELRLLIDPQQMSHYRGIIPEAELQNAALDGIQITDPLLRRRFIISYCKARSGNPARASLLRTCTYLFLFKNYDVKWWIQFAEIQLGFRIGKYDPNQEGQKALLEQAVRGLAMDASAVISKDSDIEFKEMLTKAASHQVYSELAKYCNDEFKLVVLGHTGADESTPGKLGGEDTAQEVKRELIEADASVLDESITDDLIRPFVDYNFGPQEEYPYYQTDLSPAMDLSAEADVDQKLQNMGFPISRKYVKEKYGRPLPDPKDTEDEILKPIPNQAPGQFAIAGKDELLDGKKKLLTKRLTQTGSTR